MATVKIRIREDAMDKLGFCPICVVYQNGRKETFFSTGKKTNPIHFNKGNTTEIVSKKADDSKEINLAVKGLFSKISNFVDGYKLMHNCYPSNDWLKRQVNGNNQSETNVFDLFDSFIKHQQTKGICSVSSGTIANYEKVIRKMKQFNASVSIKDLNNSYAEKYSQWLVTECGYLSSSVGEHLKVIGTFLRYCKDNGHEIGNISLFKGSNDKTWATYLTFDEIKLLCTFSTQYEQTRDAFVLQSCLGVRYSDLKTIISTKIIKEGFDYYYVTKTKKTNKLIKVKLIDIAKDILTNRSSADWIPSLNDFNRELKLLFKDFGFTEIISLSKGSGIAKQDFIVPKYKLISSHTARRTYINLMRKLKVDDATISAITGQSLAVLRGYYQPSESDTNEAMEMLNTALG